MNKSVVFRKSTDFLNRISERSGNSAPYFLFNVNSSKHMQTTESSFAPNCKYGVTQSHTDRLHQPTTPSRRTPIWDPIHRPDSRCSVTHRRDPHLQPLTHQYHPSVPSAPDNIEVAQRPVMADARNVQGLGP